VVILSAVTTSSTTTVAVAGTGFDTGRGSGTAAEFLHELLVLAVDGVALTKACRAGRRTTPVLAALAVGTIASHMTCVTADTTDDGGSVVALLRAIVFPVTDLTAVLTSLVLVITQSTIECSKLSKLITLQLVLALRDGSSSFNDGIDQLLRLVNLLFSIRHDQTVQILLLVRSMGSIGAALALLDGALSTDGDFCARISFHLLEGVATRSNKETNY